MWQMTEPGYTAMVWKDTSYVYYYNNWVSPVETATNNPANLPNRKTEQMPLIARKYRDYYHLSGTKKNYYFSNKF